MSSKILPGREIAIKHNEVNMRLFVDMNVGTLCTYSNISTNKYTVFCFNIKVSPLKLYLVALTLHNCRHRRR